LADKQEYKISEEKEVKAPIQEKVIPAESRAMAIITEILQKKMLVIGIPVAAIVIAVILILMHSSREKNRNNAALEYETSRSMEEFLGVYQKYSNSSYGAFALEKAAKIALQDGNNAKARELAQKFLTEYPQNSLSIYVKTYIPLSLENEGRYNEAIAAYKEIIEKDPKMDVVSDSLNLRIGFCYEMKADFGNAKSYYTKLASRSGLTGQQIEGVPSVWSSDALARLREIDKKEKIAKNKQIETLPKEQK